MERRKVSHLWASWDRKELTLAWALHAVMHLGKELCYNHRDRELLITRRIDGKNEAEVVFQGDEDEVKEWRKLVFLLRVRLFFFRILSLKLETKTESCFLMGSLKRSVLIISIMQGNGFF